MSALLFLSFDFSIQRRIFALGPQKFEETEMGHLKYEKYLGTRSISISVSGYESGIITKSRSFKSSKILHSAAPKNSVKMQRKSFQIVDG